MKKLVSFFIFCIALLFSIILFAQKASTTELRVTYTQLPYEPLPGTIKTYSVKIHPENISFKFIHLNKPVAYVETGTSSNYGSVEKAENDFLFLPGYQKIKQDGDLKVNVFFKKLIVRNILTKTGTGQFAENGSMVQRTYYYYEFDYSYHASIEITGPGNESIYKKVFKNIENQPAYYGEAQDTKREGFGNSYLSANELETSFQQRFILDQEITWTRDALLEIKKYLFNNLGKPLVYADFDIVTGKGKADYTDLEAALTHMKTAFELISENKGDVTKSETQLKDAIVIWEKALKEGDPSNNKARISEDIITGLYYNIGVANVWMRKFDIAEEWFAKANETKYGNKLYRKVKDLITDYKKRWKANGLIN